MAEKPRETWWFYCSPRTWMEPGFMKTCMKCFWRRKETWQSRVLTRWHRLDQHSITNSVWRTFLMVLMMPKTDNSVWYWQDILDNTAVRVPHMWGTYWLVRLEIYLPQLFYLVEISSRTCIHAANLFSADRFLHHGLLPNKHTARCVRLCFIPWPLTSHV